MGVDVRPYAHIQKINSQSTEVKYLTKNKTRVFIAHKFSGSKHCGTLRSTFRTRKTTILLQKLPMKPRLGNMAQKAG